MIPQTKPPLASAQTAVLLLLGLALGVFSGLFGVGGGFVIVPALVLFGGMEIHRAVATSLLVITLVSLSGIASYLSANRPIDFVIAGVFALGGVLGTFLGVMLGRRISGPSLQRGFSLMIVAVAAFITIRSVL